MATSRRPGHLIVVGGSAGALGAIKTILRGLPADIDACVLVTLHTRATGPGRLATVLQPATTLQVCTPSDHSPLRAGTVYVAAPNRHLKVIGQTVELTYGPREHHTRPAIDVLFRSAARSYGSSVIAVLLSGYGGDGSGGIIAVNAHRGIAIVQRPDDAEAPTMPARALALGDVDFSAPAADIPDIITRIVRADTRDESPKGEEGKKAMSPKGDDVERMIAHDMKEQVEGHRNGQTAIFSCPDCGGVLWQAGTGAFVDYVCHVGHRFSPDTLLVQKTEELETALMEALRLLKEKAMLLRQTATRAAQAGHADMAAHLREQADIDNGHAALLQKELLETEPSSLNNVEIEEQVGAVETLRRR